MELSGDSVQLPGNFGLAAGTYAVSSSLIACSSDKAEISLVQSSTRLVHIYERMHLGLKYEPSYLIRNSNFLELFLSISVFHVHNEHSTA